MFQLRSLAILLAGFCLPVSAYSAEIIRLRADQWMPFNGDPADSALPGYGIEVARIILAPHDVTLDYQTLAWGDALKAVAAGEIDAVIGANRTEAAGLVVPSEPIGEPRVALYVRHDTAWRYENLASLLKVRLGVIADYKYWESLDGFIDKQREPRVVKFAGDSPLKDGLAKLLAGEIDVFAESAPVFAWQLKADGVPPAKIKSVYIHEADPVFFAFSPKHPRAQAYAAIFDRGLRELRASGRLEEILARYGQRDWRRK